MIDCHQHSSLVVRREIVFDVQEEENFVMRAGSSNPATTGTTGVHNMKMNVVQNQIIGSNFSGVKEPFLRSSKREKASTLSFSTKAPLMLLPFTVVQRPLSVVVVWGWRKVLELRRMSGRKVGAYPRFSIFIETIVHVILKK